MKEVAILSESRLSEPRFPESPTKCSATIFGEVYQLKSTISPERLLQIAEEVDATMRSLSSGAPEGVPLHQIAVLAALRIASDRLHREEKLLTLIDRSLIDMPL